MGSPRIPFNFLLCLSSCVLLQGDEGPAGPPGVPGLEVSVADQEEVRLLGTELVGTYRAASRGGLQPVREHRKWPKKRY